MDIAHKTGLILSGGGARAAYQAGVLQAISRILAEAGWPATRNPFAVVCGTSAGAINATGLACRADDFGDAVDGLCAIWHDIAVHQVYRADSIAVLRSGARWLSLLSLGWLLRSWHAAPPNSLLDNTPLAGLLHRMLDLPRLDAALEAGHLDALAVTASSYSGGNHVTFYQSARPVEPWRRHQRVALADQIGVEHLLASSALPFIFPAVPLYLDGRLEYCGDGSMRQLAPISPAIHLGATRVLVVGAGRMSESEDRTVDSARVRYPSLAQIAGHALSSIFLDSLAADIERLNRVNQTLAMLPRELLARTPLRPVALLVIAPSERLDDIAARHTHDLPGPVRTLLAGIGATEARGAALASYLLFEPGYTRELMALGREDTHARRDDVLEFFA
ncbi:patatin-like phospholipase family protein [Herbaspirillum sp. SJZ107]|uniref:patatin-like phospholipase family protein n=1 Tax=Herbaspirillum sp. SJZ107 TaxID=2572881 RepID=UPI00116F9F30|nr:patatin-like phospholipase family protein [Herbaspirillum sp. SJZ107]TQK10509.1 NTE family protein [Herbaspirillum sp. SJZ107]